jgi:hypothetical protein
MKGFEVADSVANRAPDQAALRQQVFHVPQRQRETNIKHHDKPDYLR